MKHEPIFQWDPDTGIATCALTDGYNIFLGMATCAEGDRDMMNEKTGMQIAMYRARIDYLKHVRDNILKPRLAALKQLYFSINQSKYFNPNSYETRMLQRQIYLTDSDLRMIKEDIAEVRQYLNEYLDRKAEFYQKVREHRDKDKNN